MRSGTYAAFCNHAQEEHPKEACGLLASVDGVERYYGCRNTASDPLNNFELHPADYLKVSQAGKILAVCHSHPNGPAGASEADRTACEASGLPWYVLTWPGQELERIEPVGYRAPLLGRAFVHGIHDCYSLLRDYYWQELKIDLPDFDRDDLWWDKDQNLYLDNFGAAGFSPVPEADLRMHDVILMQIRAKVPNHAAVYLGDQVMLHHLYGQLSCRTVYGGYWAKNTTHVLRHEALK